MTDSSVNGVVGFLLGAVTGGLLGLFVGSHSAYKNACQQAGGEIVDAVGIYRCMPRAQAAEVHALAAKLKAVRQ